MKKETPEDGVLVSPSCFRQRVNLPAAQVAGLSAAELAAALAFEIEPFSGIPRADGEMAWLPREDADPARRVFDVVQIRRTDLASAVAQARAAGRRVAAVTAVPESVRGETVRDLPCIPVRAKGAFAAHPWTLWAAVCLLAAAALVWEWMQVRTEVRALRADVAGRRALQAEQDRLASKASSLRRELDDLARRRADAERAQARVAALRAAGRVLLEAVPAACRDESVVRTVRPSADGAGLVLSGAALSPDAATRTLVRLTETLSASKSGWTVRPGAVGAPAPGGTCAFDCALAFDAEGGIR